LLLQYGFQDSAPHGVPADPCSFLDHTLVADQPIDTLFPYRNVVGSCQFASNGTHLDITYAIGQVSKFLQQPKTLHVKYLKGCPDLRITYTANPAKINQVTAYSDADFATDFGDRKSRTGYVLMLNGGPVIWASQKQGCTTMSTTESEYIAAASIALQVVWLCRMLAEIGCPQIGPTPLYIDNQSAIRLILNPEFHKPTKHVDLRYHKIREIYGNGDIRPLYIPTDNQPADLLTKPLPQDHFERLKTILNLTTLRIESNITDTPPRVGV
jgi:hypothetical protein